MAAQDGPQARAAEIDVRDDLQQQECDQPQCACQCGHVADGKRVGHHHPQRGVEHECRSPDHRRHLPHPAKTRDKFPELVPGPLGRRGPGPGAWVEDPMRFEQGPGEPERERSVAAETEEEPRSPDGGEHSVLSEQEPWAAGDHGHPGAEHEKDHDRHGQGVDPSMPDHLGDPADRGRRCPRDQGGNHSDASRPQAVVQGYRGRQVEQHGQRSWRKAARGGGADRARPQHAREQGERPGAAGQGECC
jgi:hypothetical protein